MIAGLVCLLCVVVVTAKPHHEFPQWDTDNWVVRNTGEQITLRCTHDTYYPFIDIRNNAVKVQWILPQALAYIHIAPGSSLEGWMVGERPQNYTMTITNTGFNEPSVANGMYLCAALAPVPKMQGVYSWYYLRWGVGLYSNVAAMNPGGIERYTTQFTVASLAVAIFLVLASLLASTLHFRYKGEVPEDSEDGSFLDDDADDYGSDRDDLKVPVTPDDSIAKNSGAV